MPSKSPKRKGKSYKFTPPVTVRKVLASTGNLGQFCKKRSVIHMLATGSTYEDIAEKGGMSTREAFKLCQDIIQEWIDDMSLDAKQAREVQLRELDALRAIVWKEVAPKPLLKDGEPVYDGITSDVIMQPPDPIMVKLLLEISDRKAKYLGLFAEEGIKGESGPKELVRREYVGVDIDSL